MSGGALALRVVHYNRARDYKSPDQIAFEEAVGRKDAHTWLGTQSLGYFNVYDLHQCLILGNASHKPFLISDPMIKLQLTAFKPDSTDVEAALRDNAFYHSLRDVVRRGHTLPSAYREALSLGNDPYASIFKRELTELKF